MLNYMLRKFFNKEKEVAERPLTIIIENRASTSSRRTIMYRYKEERQETCLSQYFSNIKGLNTIERNIYSKLV